MTLNQVKHAKIGLLASRSEQPIHPRIHCRMELVLTPVSQPTLEPNIPLSLEDYSGTTSSGNNNDSLVAERAMVLYHSFP
ncbi:hypothetical protein A0J61_08665 [Choanephora cucurbitarum]|uniref:Uncharacterized protein n=1 Tax=Choanephora cucurbitarum TaxID=101091 RepID=A0A1C7N3Q6_9FUNG|nr:hypothetical protein A0J61_08665 [Choanephora cucurbitarum]